jgi:transposase
MAKSGHNVKLIPAQHVTPFVRGNKNYHNDAFAITEASQRPYIRFVPIKSEHQQEISCLHRICERLSKNKVALSNQSRGLLSEFAGVFYWPHRTLKWLSQRDWPFSTQSSITKYGERYTQ